MKAKEKRIALEAIADGRANLVVGTHAVLTDTVEFKNLGLAIVDEQHRFGVRQRGLLAGKAQSPHLLVMSATPIPRTLGLLMYGDLDISVLDELPPGRKPIKTWFITGKKRRDMYGFLDKQIAAGIRSTSSARPSRKTKPWAICRPSRPTTPRPPAHCCPTGASACCTAS